ncbi:MAG: ribosome maturation factor RimP [Bryobacteraceae bacterium]
MAVEKSELIGKVTEIVEHAGRRDGIEAVEVQWLGGGKSRVLRIFIDKPDGVTHGDCENISRSVDAVLDTEDLVEGAYTLEVSSPGVERKLSRPADFERFAGQPVKLVLRQPLDGFEKRGKLLEGTLSGCHEGVVSVSSQAGETVQIPLDQIERANLKFTW